ncbi:N-acetylglucosaminyldiphosphoundecaprenol N-acetyl-beta-D-mannosaminyltransferase [Lachnospiraceae bacterium XBB1006]|nr:N-acetylglucosaminyldiphosphoundecaprenol N-acetyl-beta-D-mannosaminyltransferase [Lachnospiraceae bacterium XBB1006]
MAKKIEVMNIKLDNYPMREAMMLVETFLSNTVLNTIEEVSRPMIVAATEDSSVKECIESLDLAIPGDREMLLQAGISSGSGERNSNFFYEFAKRIVRNGKNVFVLAEDAEGIARMQKFLAEGYDGVKVIGSCALSDYADEAGAINEINIQMPDVILSVLSSPIQERFLTKHKEHLHAKIWYGINNEGLIDHGSSRARRKLRRILRRLAFRRYISCFEKQKNES